jgi:hypothetical protein
MIRGGLRRTGLGALASVRGRPYRVCRNFHPEAVCRLFSTHAKPVSWWLKADPDRVLAVQQAVAAYASSPSSLTAEAALAAIECDKHALDLNRRMSQMFSNVQSGDASASAVVAEHQHLASRTSVVAFAHKRMENQELLMESMEHSFSVTPPAAGESVLFECNWSIARVKVPGMTQMEYSAIIIANGTRILRVSDVETSVSQQVDIFAPAYQLSSSFDCSMCTRRIVFQRCEWKARFREACHLCYA